MENLKISDKLEKVLSVLEENNDAIAFEILYLGEPTAKYFNGLKITNVDISKDYYFNVTIDGKQSDMKISMFIKYYLKGMFSPDEINKFLNNYNKVKNGNKLEIIGKRIQVGEFNYNPLDVRSTFLSLTTKTYPYPNDPEVLKYLPELNKDKHGNYYKIIGSNDKPSIMFTSHLDTADRTQVSTTLLSRIDGDNEIIFTDGKSILGADDKAGVTVMLYMMENNVPGLYYFFIGEERGAIGSSALSKYFTEYEYLSNVKKCVSFDRRKEVSVITKQLSRTCCSDAFAKALCDQYNKNGLNLSPDPTGVFTDSASFLDDIPECTNISVGYNYEHTTKELQNITYLEKLCKASVNIDWDSLPIARKIGFDSEMMAKYKDLIIDIKKTAFDGDIKVTGRDEILYIIVDIEGLDTQSAYDSLISLQFILKKYKITDSFYISGDHIKIMLR